MLHSLIMKETLISALYVSGKILLKYFGQQIDFKVKESQSSIVTTADLKSDSYLVNVIREKFPAHNIISEEGGFHDKNSIYTWVIDPLDGTSNFASAIPWFGILITLFEKSRPIMAGAYLPIQDQLYFAEIGKGTLRNEKPFVMNNPENLVNSLVAYSVDYTDNEMEFNRSISIYRNLVKTSRNIRSTNSLVDFLFVAEGKFGGCINLFTKIWDISGLGLIVSEAGGVIRDINGEEILYDLDKNIIDKNFAVIAGSQKIVNEIKRSVLYPIFSEKNDT